MYAKSALSALVFSQLFQASMCLFSDRLFYWNDYVHGRHVLRMGVASARNFSNSSRSRWKLSGIENPTRV